MTFYLQDWVTGKNATALPVAGRNKTSKPMDFSTIVVIDDAVTAGPKRSSPQVGCVRILCWLNSWVEQNSRGPLSCISYL